MDKDKKFQEVIDRLASNADHWREIKKVLADEIRGNEEIIAIIDKRVKQLETEISKLN